MKAAAGTSAFRGRDRVFEGLLPLVIVLSTAATPLSAFETLGASWSDGRVSYRLNPNFPEEDLSGTREQQIEILRCAAETWTTQTAADFEFVYEGTTSAVGLNSRDSVHSVSWSDSDGGDALAVTVLSGSRGRARHFDIVFYDRSNGFTNHWNGPQDPVHGTIDIAGVAVHEFGHALGLDHTPVEEATLFASARNRGLPLRTLHEDDRAGVEFLYGTRPRGPITPVIDAISPVFGPGAGGNEVVLSGSNFSWTGDSTLFFGSNVVDRSRYDVESCGTLRISPLESGPEGPVDVVIQNSLGSYRLEGGYRYGPGAPEISAVEPSLGPLEGGTVIIVRGKNLTEDARIFVGGVALEDIELVDSDTITGRLPAAALPGTVDVVLVQGQDTAELAGAFTYTANILTLSEATGAPGETASVDVLVSTDEVLRGVSFAFSYDPTAFAVAEISVGGTVAQEAEFAAPNIDNATGIATFGIVMSFSRPEPNIPVGDDQRIAVIRGNISPDAAVGSEMPLRLEQSAGSPPIDLLFTPIDDPGGLRPFSRDGSVQVVSGPLFLRGDDDANGRAELTDAISILATLFQGAPRGDCLDASDANDDGAVDISDPIFLLLFLFSGGQSPPPPSSAPGADPTPDNLGCDRF